MGMLPDDIKPSLQGVIPACISTCALDGVPNATYISQVYYVDPDHVAISYQFFNKTVRNIRENPRAAVIVLDPRNGEHWSLQIEFARAETQGPLFDQMEMQLEALASMQGMADVFKLQAAHVYRVTSASKSIGQPG
jgi:predicted pyridoxine 5'-phosphate oxidase superfamily flavin-nucleotide-binding protein